MPYAATILRAFRAHRTAVERSTVIKAAAEPPVSPRAVHAVDVPDAVEGGGRDAS